VRFCHRCGSSLQPEDRFCTRCGVALYEEETATEDEGAPGADAQAGREREVEPVEAKEALPPETPTSSTSTSTSTSLLDSAIRAFRGRCHECGAPLAGDERFCTSCGVSLRVPR
jgi:rRNA maturation endonuclease Nob1